MSAGTVILIVVILAIVAVAAAVMSTRMRHGATGRGFAGPEYDRLAGEVGPRKARAEFERRRQRVDRLGLKPLAPERRAGYAGRWDAAQEQFVDSPAEAVNAAGSLVTAVAVDRGYRVADQDELITDLSVYHGRQLDGYRRARQTTERAGQATTEDLRRALLDYRGLFVDLLESPEGDGGARATGLTPEQAAGLTPERAPEVAPERAADAGPAPVADQRPWKQVTQGLHWKTRQQEDSDVAATRP